MAHLWIRDDHGWAILPLRGGEALDLTRLPPAGQPDLVGEAGEGGHPTVWSLDAGGGEAWALFATPAHHALVNGIPVEAGMRVLSDRDEIAVRDRAGLFFATERLAALGSLPAESRAVGCARCRQPIAPGSAAVCCPRCGLWHHETDSLPCWSHLPECGMCPQPTPLDGTYRWTPEEL